LSGSRRAAVLTREAHLSIGILPSDVEVPFWHDHGFTILDDRADEEPTLVHIETLSAGLNVTDPEQVARYRSAFERLASTADYDAEARAVISHIAEDLRAR
jgi:hypothetical protein